MLTTFATHDDFQCVNYGRVLEAAPFIRATAEGVDDAQLDVLLGDKEQKLKVNIALSTINNKGVTADTDHFRELCTKGEVLKQCEQELCNEQARWRVRLAETSGCLTRARVPTCIHLYLNHTALIPDHYHPKTMCIGGVTLCTALEDMHTRGLHWYAMLHLHDEEYPGNSPSCKPLPFPHCCQLCNKLQPCHTVWDCPKVRDCCYCKACNHSHLDCPNPNAECFYNSECVVPLTHQNNVTCKACQCPAAALHTRYYADDYR